MTIDTRRSGAAARSVGMVLLGIVMAQARPAGPAAAGEATAQSAPKLEIGFRNIPDPPRSGENSVEVTLKHTDGTMVDDAEVSVVYYMPAMPAMNMPEMKSSVSLKPAGKGLYRGKGSLVMGGTWNVTITASRSGKTLGTRKLSVIARQ